MGELMEAGPRAIGVPRRFKGIQGGTHGTIADHVNMNLEARGIEGGEQFLDLIVAEHQLRVAAEGIGIGFEHHACAVFENAIEKEFRRVNLEHAGIVVAAQVFETAQGILGLLSGIDSGGCGNTHRQVTGTLQTAVNPGVAFIH